MTLFPLLLLLVTLPMASVLFAEPQPAAALSPVIDHDLQRRLAPAPKMRMISWAIQNVQNERGRPYAHNAYPHLGAPGGPCDAFDDPLTRTIVEQYATRLGKTFFGQCCLEFTAAHQPGPMMFATSTEKLAREIVARTYKLLEGCRPLAGQLVREDLRGMALIELADCRIDVAWSRSPSTLADKNIRVGFAAEIDKWERLNEKEADPLDLFLDRGKDFPNHKFVFESTPSIRSRSRIEALRLASSDCRYLVPCPHCRHYQPLEFARIEWERPESGDHDPDLAAATARYVCAHCDGQIADHHRAEMMQLGVWLPRGAGIDHALALATASERQARLRDGTLGPPPATRFWQQPYLLGLPERRGPDAGFQLSSLYALQLGWGEIAARWIKVYKKPASLQNFVTQWLGETWEIRRHEADWEKVGKRIISDVPPDVCPLWGSLVCVGIDRQLDCYKYVVDAFGPDDRDHTMAYGRVEGPEALDWIYQHVILRRWPHADGGTIGVARTLVDGGYKPKQPYALSRRCLSAVPMRIVLTCHGATRPLGAPFRQTELDKRSEAPGLPYIEIDMTMSQQDINERLYEAEPFGPGSTSLFFGTLADHEGFLREIINDQLVTKFNAQTNKESRSWQRITDYPNDFRDCKRMAKTGQLIYSGGRPLKSRSAMLEAGQKPKRRSLPPLLTPDGRPFMASERHDARGRR